MNFFKDSNSDNRMVYLDSLKFLSIFIISLTHFIAMFNSSYFKYWNEYQTKYLIQGITGKLGVAFFAVITAYVSNKKRKYSVLEWSIKRYTYFFLSGLLINSILCLYNKIPFYKAILEAIKIGYGIFPTFWCIRDFLIASIVSYIFKRYNVSLKIRLLFIILLIILNFVWISIAMFGTLIDEINSSKFFSNRKIRIFLFCFLFLSIQRPENNITYILDGFFAVVTILVIKNSPTINRLLENDLFSFFGRRTMSIFIMHPIIFEVIGTILFNNYLSCDGLQFIIALFYLFYFLFVIIINNDYFQFK